MGGADTTVIAASWNRFFFGPRDVRPVALMRMGVGLITAWMLLERVAVARSALSDEGWLPTDAAAQLMDPLHWSVFHVIDAPGAVAAILLLGGVSAGLFTLGLFTRPAGLLAFVVLASTHVRNPAVLYGADSVARIWMFYLLLMPCGRAWSIDAIRRRVRSGGRAFLAPAPTMEAWPVRLLQFQVALIYLTTGISKSYGTDYHEGTALWYALANPTYSRFDPLLEPVFATAAPVLALLTIVTLWWELAFAFMVLFRRSRTLALGIGVFVHGGIFVALQIQFWGPLMLLSYFSFISGRSVHRLWLRHVRETRDKRWNQRITFAYDPDAPLQAALARRVAALDAFGLVRRTPRHGETPRWFRGDTRETIADAEVPSAVRALLPIAARPWWRVSQAAAHGSVAPLQPR